MDQLHEKTQLSIGQTWQAAADTKERAAPAHRECNSYWSFADLPISSGFYEPINPHCRQEQLWVEWGSQEKCHLRKVYISVMEIQL